MQVRLVTPHTLLATSVAEALRAQDHEVELVQDTVFECSLRHLPDIDLASVTGLVEQLKPLLPAVQPDSSLEDAEVELRLGEAKPLGSWEVKVHVESEDLGDRLRSRLLALGFRDDGLEIEEPERDVVKYGGATPFARQVVRWLLAQERIHATEKKAWGDDDDDIWIHARDPDLAGKTPRQRYPVEIHGDDYERMYALKERLEAAGFARVAVRSLDAMANPRFALDEGPLARHHEDATSLRAIATAFLEEQEVDVERFPVAEKSSDEAKGHARIDLPLAAARDGTLRPYTGAWPDRWDVVIRTDQVEAVSALRQQLEDNGYRHITTEPLPATAFGFAVRWGAAEAHPEVGDLFRGVLDTLLEERGLLPDYALSVRPALDDDDARIVLELPLGVADRLPLEERIREAARGWELTFKAPRPDAHEALQATLKELPWKSWETEREESGDAEISYGGAPIQLVEHIQALVERLSGIRLPLSKDWSDSDDDIWVQMPRADGVTVAEGDVPLDLSGWLTEGLDAREPTPFVDVQADTVRIGPVGLPRRRDGDRSLVPRVEQFTHYCLDQRTAETLLHVAESVVLGEPCLLEGETSVSKTSIVQFLAMLLEQPLIRLNLNGQTDTGELVGRYVPQDVAASLPVDPGELVAAAELLESESRMILERAAHEGRTLTRVEVQQIMANERMTVHPWRWQDGLVVTAMKRGWWVVLDELNLAEPQILERLNPVLERVPSLVLSEHDNTVIGPGGVPVHPDFRVFATMNPAEYAGRSALSPAYRDRWRAYRFVSAPGEAEYAAMLRFLVSGAQPGVTVAGQRWLGTDQEAPLPSLAEVEGIDDFLRALARFHGAIEEAVGRRGGARGGQLGGRRRDRYVFSRRGLLAVMDYLGSALATDGGGVRSMRKALARYYLGRVQPGADQRVVAQLLDAAGIGPTTWAPDQLDRLVAEGEE